MKTNDIDKCVQRAAMFDMCVSEMPQKKQAEYQALVEWVAENILLQKNATKSAKELIIQCKRYDFKVNNGWIYDPSFKIWHKSSAKGNMK